MLYEPVDAVLLMVGIGLVLACMVAIVLIGDQRRIPFLVVVACGLGVSIVILGALFALGLEHHKGRDLLHAGLAIAVPIAVAAGLIAAQRTTPTLEAAWATLGALGGVAALPLAAVIFASAVCASGACS